MSWRFRKSFTVIPGLRLNLSKGGLSASIGGAPFTLNVGPRGLYGTASIPGTGISFRQRLTNEPDSQPLTEPRPQSPLSHQTAPPDPSALREIRSASTEV